MSAYRVLAEGLVALIDELEASDCLGCGKTARWLTSDGEAFCASCAGTGKHLDEDDETTETKR